MKKIISTSILTTTMLISSSYAASFNLLDFLEGNSITKNLEMCYDTTISIGNIENLCSATKFNIDSITKSFDKCNALPDLSRIGLKKKSATQSLSFGTNILQEYCEKSTGDIEKKLSSITSNAEIWTIDNDFEKDFKFPNGLTKEQFYLGDNRRLNIDELNKKQNESITAMYYSSKEPYHQQTAKYLIDLAKLKEVDDATDITTADVKVAENMIDYEKQVIALSASVAGDIESSSANSITSSLSTKLTSYQDANGQSTAHSNAREYANEQKTIVKNTAKNKKGLYKRLLASKDDLAVPTQQTLNLYKDNIKPKYAMLIRRQQARESYINALIDTEVKIKQDIIDLTAKKAVIMKSQFDETQAKSDIDAYVD